MKKKPNPNRLQQAVFDVENKARKTPHTWDSMTAAVAASSGMTQQLVSQYILEYGTITKTPKPAQAPAPAPVKAAPAPAPVKAAPAPAPVKAAPAPAPVKAAPAPAPVKAAAAPAPVAVAPMPVAKVVTPSPPTVAEVTVSVIKPTGTLAPNDMSATGSIKVFNTGGRGKRQCPNCKVYVGIRTEQCVCGHEFQKKVANAAPEIREARVVIDPVAAAVAAEDTDDDFGNALPNGRCTWVHTPAGKPPHNLNGTAREEVHKWAEQIRSDGFREGRYYTVHALIYWVRYFYDINGKSFCPSCNNKVENRRGCGCGYVAPHELVKAHLYNLYPEDHRAA